MGNKASTLEQVGLALGVAFTILGLIQTAANDLFELLPIIALAPLGYFILRSVARRLAHPADLRFLLRMATLGLLLRLGVALIIHQNLPEWFFAPDQVTYQDVGWRTLQYHRGLTSMPWQLEDTTEIGYFYWNALMFVIFGHMPLAPKIANAIIGTASGLVAYRIGGELAGKEAARLSTAFTMLFPSLVLWSAQNLRDPMVLLVTLLLFWAALRLKTRPSGRSLFAVLLGVSLLLLLRDYLAVMVAFGLVGSSFLSRSRGFAANAFIGLLLLALAIGAYQQFGLGSEWVEAATFENLSQQRQNLAFGGSAFRTDQDISTPLRGLLFLPIGLAFFLFSPFPWQIGSTLSLMTLPEQLVWYAIIPAVVSGTAYLVRHRFSAVSPILVFLALTTIVYALVEGNAGTAYRHRSQVLVFFFILASVGLALRMRKSRPAQRAPQPARTQPGGSVEGTPR